ncbi:MAG: hypothetical protein KJO31_07050 [Gammaproteobacteria bacterium]|nr:hypothetical protein [Gammaproteobacteria bacterium]
MERFAQYLDELEDVVYALLTIGERVRRALQILLVLSASLVLQVLGIWLALNRPPLALATVSLLVVCMLYRSVIAPATGKLVLT